MMGESPCMLRSLSHPSGSSRDAYEGDPIRALRESVSFGRYVSDSLDWGRWSSFTHNRYLEEAKIFSKPGSVAQKKAYFDAIKAKQAAALLEGENAGNVVSESNGAISCDLDSENPKLKLDNGSEEETEPSQGESVDHVDFSEHCEESCEFKLQEKNSITNEKLASKSPSKPVVSSSSLQSSVNLKIQVPRIKEDNGIRSSDTHVMKSVEKAGNSKTHESSMKISIPFQTSSKTIMTDIFKHSSRSSQSETISQPKSCVACERRTCSPVRHQMGEKVAKIKEFFENLEQKIRREAAKMQLQPKAKEKTKNGSQKQAQIIVLKPKPVTPTNHRNKFQFIRPQSPMLGRKVTPIGVQDANPKLPKEPRPSFGQENVSPNIQLSF